MEKNISYLNRTYNDYKEALIEMSERYYPGLSNSFRDSSVGAWQIDLAADIADNLSYHIDRVYQETNINSAQEKESLFAIARNNGVKIPGPKGAMAEVRISVTLSTSEYESNSGPIIKRGTRFAASSQEFELLHDVNFSSQFDEDGDSDRTIIPTVSNNGIITGYTLSKLAVVTAGETRVHRQTIKASDVKPFMEVVIPVNGVMNVESIIVVDGQDVTKVPTYDMFYGDCQTATRFYEVDNLAQTKIWGESNATPVIYKYSASGGPVCCVTKGEWKTIKHKFITEYTDKGYLKVIFGAGSENNNINISAGFKKWQLSKIMNNNNLGVLPKPGSTMFILYRVGGGASSNVAKGAINRVSYLSAQANGSGSTENLMRSIKVENTVPSISGKDMPTEQELKYYIKYHKAAQERCVTIKDYIDRILLLPPKYGTPFRVGVAEENNKIMIYLLGVDNDGKLSDKLPLTLIENIENYLAEYRMINDYIEIKAGRIVNISFEIDIIIDKNYNRNDVLTLVINKVKDYMDVNRHLMGEDIYVGDIEREIGNVDGVINLISLKVNCETADSTGNNSYSNTRPQQPMNGNEIDLEATDWILYNDGDSMMEIKNPETDIKIRVKER